MWVAAAPHTDQVRGSRNPPPALPERPRSRYGARGWEWTVTKTRLPPELHQQACGMTTGHSIKQIKKGMDRNAKARPFGGSLMTQRTCVVSSNLPVSLLVTHASQGSYLHVNLSARTCLEPPNQSPQPLSDMHLARTHSSPAEVDQVVGSTSSLNRAWKGWVLVLVCVVFPFVSLLLGWPYGNGSLCKTVLVQGCLLHGVLGAGALVAVRGRGLR